MYVFPGGFNVQDEQVRLVIEEVQEHATAMKELSRCAKLQAGCQFAGLIIYVQQPAAHQSSVALFSLY